MDSLVTIFGPSFSPYVRMVLLCCEEKGIAYQKAKVKFGSTEHRAMHPFGKVPVLKHGDALIYETSAICRYLDRAFAGPSLSPSDPLELAYMDQWIGVCNSYFEPVLFRSITYQYAFPTLPNKTIDRATIDAAAPQAYAYVGILLDALQEQSYLSGKQFGLADCLFAPVLDYFSQMPEGRDILADAGLVLDYLNRIQQRASCKKILKKAVDKKVA